MIDHKWLDEQLINHNLSPEEFADFMGVSERFMKRILQHDFEFSAFQKSAFRYFFKCFDRDI